uniref:Methyltransferase 22, Kin17 lysine n=1 Tax=Hippocampus comes TaxID=109280 RepID=A0A3Q2YSN4_HIPCM
MNQIVFQHDSVLSDVHMFLPNARHRMTRLNNVGQPVFISKFKFLSNAEKQGRNDEAKRENSDSETHLPRAKDDEEGSDRNEEPALDEDGDLDVKCIKAPFFFSSRQVWRGALVLADFILSKPLMFKGATVVELGAGSGLTSIIMATLAKRVYCTDVGEDLLGMCQRNITLNEHMIERAGEEFAKSQFTYDPDVEFSWTEEEVADIHDNASIILAADVCYDDELTDGFFRTLYRLCNNFAHACNIFISIEKRFNFTLRQMDVSCDAYNHFQHCLSQLEDVEDGQCSYAVEQLPCTFPQFLQYERIDHLELWKVTAKRVPFDQAQPRSEQATS